MQTRWKRSAALLRSRRTGSRTSGAKRSVSDLSSSNHFNRPKARYRMLTPCSSSRVFASYQMSRSRFCKYLRGQSGLEFRFRLPRSAAPSLPSLSAGAERLLRPDYGAEARSSSPDRDEGAAPRLTKQVENGCRLAVHNLNRADVLRPQGNVYQSVARTQVEQSPPVRQQPVSYRCSHQKWLPALNHGLSDSADTRSSWPAHG